MKKIYSLLLLILCFSAINAQQSNEGFTFDSEARTYLLYVPTAYNAATDTLPLVLALHGLGDTKENFAAFNGFHSLAEANNFIVATPQALNPTETVDLGIGTPIALSDYLQNAWNSGAGGTSMPGVPITLPTAIYPSSSRDDVGFLSVLIDSISTSYNVNPNRVYSTGFSMGGFMTNRLACELSDKIAAIASVSGTIGNAISSSCNPDEIIPALHVHSIDDQTVAYSPNSWGMDAEANVDFWVANNNCDTPGDTTDLTNVASDTYNSQKILFTGGDLDSEVEFYRLEGPDHVGSWYAGTNDFNTSEVIWDFFDRHEKKQEVEPIDTTVSIVNVKTSSFEIYPNPTTDIITISFENKIELSSVAVMNTLGKTITTRSFDSPVNEIVFNLKNENQGVYFFQIKDTEGNFSVVRFYKK